MYRILEPHKCIYIICQNIKILKNKNYFIMSETTFHFTMMLGFLHKYFELSCLHLTLTRLWRLKRFVGGSSIFNWFKNNLSQNVSCITYISQKSPFSFPFNQKPKILFSIYLPEMIISIPFPPWNVCCGYLQFLWRIVLFGTNRESEKFKFVSKSGRALIRYQSGGRGNKIIPTLTQPRNLLWRSVRVFLTPSTPSPTT